MPLPRSRHTVAALATALCLIVAPLTTDATALPTAAPTRSSPATHPIVTWGASADRVAAVTGLADQTVRNLVHTSIGGSGVRISLSNAFGDRPVTFDSVYVGLQAEGAAVVPGSNHEVTFDGGSESVTVQPGGEVLSDSLAWTIPADTTLAVSVHVVGESGTVTGHNLAMQTSYVSGPTDAAADESGTAYSAEIQNWYWVESVVLEAPRRVKTVAFLGDSITDGHSSTVDTNRRWPDLLADRLAATPLARHYGVMNAGISANRVLADGAGGQSALSRFDRDVLSQPGVSTVVLLEGINDIRWDFADEPSDLIDAYRQLISRAHARDVCVIGATLTPYENGSRYSPARDQIRNAVNAWIRASGEFDGVIDFDAATRDPDHPAHFLPAYDSGDHLHPNDAGYAAMADAVDLSLLECQLP
jgi:lysophospholipase L1-like esterase